MIYLSSAEPQDEIMSLYSCVHAERHGGSAPERSSKGFLRSWARADNQDTRPVGLH